MLTTTVNSRAKILQLKVPQLTPNMTDGPSMLYRTASGFDATGCRHAMPHWRLMRAAWHE